jgi:hypothetical protein
VQDIVNVFRAGYWSIYSVGGIGKFCCNVGWNQFAPENLRMNLIEVHEFTFGVGILLSAIAILLSYMAFGSRLVSFKIVSASSSSRSSSSSSSTHSPTADKLRIDAEKQAASVVRGEQREKLEAEQAKEQSDYIRNEDLPPTAPTAAPVDTTEEISFPSGRWSGYYNQSGKQHSVQSYTLQFSDDGVVSGSGTDGVGAYTVRGVFGNKKVAFSKKYQLGSRNSDGRVIKGNKGHTVAYRAKALTANLGAGLRGEWHIPLEQDLSKLSGDFHLWPAMEGWSANSSTDAAEQQDQGERFDEGECCICFDNRINVCLRPCGHIAICDTCEAMLAAPKTCPLCRANIENAQKLS